MILMILGPKMLIFLIFCLMRQLGTAGGAPDRGGWVGLAVVASGDTDGDGVTNLEEWELKTDPIHRDSDGERIPDGLDPLPLTSRDTDGDGDSV